MRVPPAESATASRATVPRALVTGAAYLLAVVLCETISPQGAGTYGNGPWFSLGLSAGLLCCFGFRYVPLVALVFCALGYKSLPDDWALWMRAAWASLVLGECAAAAFVVRRWIGGAPEIRKPKDFCLILCSSAFAPVATVLWGAKVFEGFFMEPIVADFDQGARIVLSHATGLLVVQSFMVAFGTMLSRRPDFPPREREGRGAAENALQFTTLCLVSGAAIAAPHSSFWQMAGLLPILWIALRHGLLETSCALLLYTAARWLWPGFAEDAANTLRCLQQDSVLAVSALATGSFVSARRRRETKLRSELETQRKVLAQARLGTWNWDGGERFVGDESLAALLGFDADFFDGKERTWRELVHPSDLGLVVRLRGDCWGGKSPAYEADYRLRTRQGGWVWVQERGSVVERDLRGGPALLAGVCVEIERAKTSELRQKRILRAFDAAPDLIAVSDSIGALLYTNRSLMLFDPREGTRPGQRRALGDVFPERVTRALLLEGLSAATAKGCWRNEETVTTEDGVEAEYSLQVSASNDPATRSPDFVLIGREIGLVRREQRAALERQRRELLEGKYESLRRLAGGMGHDFNNLLTAMLGGFSLVRFGIPPASPARAYFRQIDDSGARAVELGRFLHMYAGRMQVHSSTVSLNELIRQKAPDLQHLCLDKCRLAFELDDSIHPVSVDSKLVDNACRSLVRNSLEALEGKNGRIQVRTGVVLIDAASQPEPFDTAELVAGPYVYLEVADDGPGLSDSVKNDLFVPFCSAKNGHSGTGLAGVLGTMRAHQGAVRVQSRPGEGCRVRLLFPPSRENREPAFHPFSRTSEWKGEGTVLVVDDEEAVRSVSMHMLRSMGFEPLAAKDGAEALKVVGSLKDSLKAVLLDLTMGGMDGEQTFVELRRLNSRVPIVIMSGCSEQEILERFKGRSCSAALPKPFQFDSLRSVLERVFSSDKG